MIILPYEYLFKSLISTFLMDMAKIELRIQEAEMRFEAQLREVYLDFFRDGYHFYSNKPASHQDECVARLQSEGRDVKVGSRTFDLSLKPLSTYVCIFVKKRS